MLNILTPKEIGERLRLVRQGINLTQKEVAQIINTTQIKISKIEQGKNVTTDDFINLLAFYSQSVSLDILFSEKIDFFMYDNLFLKGKDIALNKLVKEKLELLRELTHQNLSAAIELL